MVLGAIFGAVRAKRHGGRGLDMAQYGGSYAILFGIVTLILVIVLLRVA